VKELGEIDMVSMASHDTVRDWGPSLCSTDGHLAGALRELLG
jgi:hypothetical protein